MIAESLQQLMANLRSFGVGVAALNDLETWSWHGTQDNTWEQTVLRAWGDVLSIERPPELGHNLGLRYWVNQTLGERARPLVSFYWTDTPGPGKDWQKL